MTDGRVETATILFTDLVASTELRSSLGDEQAELLRREHDTLIEDGIRAFDGEVVKSLGDGFMATFSSASDSVQAAVAIQQAFERRNQGAKDLPSMHVRVGVAAGDVTRDRNDRHGIPVVQAARLCDRCEAGEIMVTTIVKLLAGTRLVGEAVDLGAVELKGLGEPVDCARIDWPTTAEGQPDVALQSFLGGAPTNVLRGRADELAKLRDLWHSTTTGATSVALVCGEPGIGKTRLVTELAAEVATSGGLVLAGRIEEGLGGPYQPFVEALLHYVRHSEQTASLGDAPGELTRIAPDLTELVGPLPTPTRADPGTEQYRLATAITSWIRTVAEERPVLLVIDDLHWAEPQTALLLRHLCTELDTSPVLVTITYRDTDLNDTPEAAGVVADLHRLSNLVLISLEGLDTEAVRSLIDDIGLEADDLDQLAALIRSHSEGNAFFANELIRHLDDPASALDPEPGDPSSLPPTITEIVRRRVNRLRAETIEVLTFAAVAGREFRLKLIGTVLGDHLDLIGAADEAIRAKLLEERGVGRYRFVHGLVAETLLADLSATRRADLHLRTAAALERENASNLDSVVGELAYHYAAAAPAGDLQRAVDFVSRAGRKAMRQLAFAEAIDFFQQALAIDADLEPGALADLYIALAEAQSHAGDPTGETVGRAVAIARELGDHERLARAALAKEMAVLGVFGHVDTGRTGLLEEAIEHSEELSVASRARLHADLALELLFADTVDRKLSEANLALDLARKSGSPETLGRVLALRYPTLWTAHTLDERLHVVEDLTLISAQLDDSFLKFLAAANGSLAMLEAGDLERAQERLVVAEELANDVGEPRLRWFATVCRAKEQIITGRLDDAQATAAAGAQLAERAGRADGASYLAAQRFCIGFHRGQLDGLSDRVDAAVEQNPAAPAFRSMRVALNTELGHIDGAQAELRELGAAGFAFPADFTHVVALCFSALGAIGAHDEPMADALYDLLLPHRGRYADAGSTWYGAVDYYLGRLAIVLGRTDDASEHLADGLARHRRVGSTPMIERTERAIASLERG